MAEATSSGRTALPIGRAETSFFHCSSENIACTLSLATNPGATTFTLMPWQTTSKAKDLLKPTTPALAAV